MFDIGITELFLLGVVALIVLGPERLPHAARMTGAWIGKLRRTLASLQVEIEREVDASEVQARLKQEAERSGLTGLAKELEGTVSDAQRIGEELLDNNSISHATSPASKPVTTTPVTTTPVTTTDKTPPIQEKEKHSGLNAPEVD